MPKGSCLKRTAIVIVVLCALAGGGIALWKFLPEESKASIQDIFNQTRDDLGDVDLPNNPLPSGDDSQQPNNGYVFMQCTDSPTESATLTNTNDSDSTTNCCNGLDSICDLRVDQILFAGVHNAMATRKDGFLLAPNHIRTLEESLQAGYRAINVDMANCDDGFQLVHGRCSLGTRSPTQVFSNLVDFLESNPSEVILLNMQIDDDAGVAPVLLDDIYNLMYAVPGFTDMLYSHNTTLSSNEWPTLRDLIDSNQRILFFLYDGTESCREDTCPTGFHDWFAYAAETEFSFSSEELVRDTATSCVVTRGDVTRAAFFGVNVFVTLPNQAASQRLNTFESLQEHMTACSSLNSGADVNVVFVDFWEDGDLPKLVQTENAKRAEAARR